MTRRARSLIGHALLYSATLAGGGVLVNLFINALPVA